MSKEQPEALRLPNLPFAVFDEFGQPCEDRVRDHFAEAFEELRSQIWQGVPDGWQLVPKEPTPEMWNAVNKLDDQCAAGNYDGKGCSIEQAWDCLLASAPPAPQQIGQSESDVRNLLARFEHQCHRMGVLWERCHGKCWPKFESDEFTLLRDELVPETKAQLLALATPAPKAAEKKPFTPDWANYRQGFQDGQASAPQQKPLLQRIAHLEATASANYGRGHADAHSMLADRIAELEQRNRDLHEDVQRFKKHALNEKAARLELERQLEEARKDAKPCPTCESLARAVMLDQTGKA